MTNPERQYKAVRSMHLILAIVALLSSGVFGYMLIDRRDVSSSLNSMPICEISSHFVVRSSDLGLAMRAAEEAEYALDRIKEELLTDVPNLTQKVEIFLWSTEAEYYDGVPHALAGSAGCSTYITLPDGEKLWRIDLLDYSPGSRALSHEVSHVLLSAYNEKARKSGNRPIPLAIHEGIAILAEGIVHDDYMMAAAVSLANENDHHSSDGNVLDRLLAATNKIEDDSSLNHRRDFYAQSYSLADFLRRNLKKEGFSEFLKQICDGADVHKAFVVAANLEDNVAHSDHCNLVANWKAHTLKNAKISHILAEAR